MREILDLEEEMALHTAAVNDIHQTLFSGGTVVSLIYHDLPLSINCECQDSPVEVYEKTFKKKINEYRGKTARQKYAKQQEYQNFHESIYVR